MLHGASYLGRGFGLWRRRPGLMLLGMVPALIVLAVLGALLIVLLLNLGDVVAWATPFADDWSDGTRGLFRFLLALTLLAAAGFVATSTFVGLTLTVGDPFYERIWRETELMLGGPVPGGGVSFVRAARDGALLSLFGLLCAAGVLVLGLLPVIGTVAGAIVGLVVSGRLLAGELVGRAFEARGIDRAGRREVLRAQRPAMLGFGVATQLFFLVPFGAILVMPAAVAGSTMLARELLERHPSAPGSLSAT